MRRVIGCSSPGFPSPLVINAWVYRYKKCEVEGFLKRLEAGEVPVEPRAQNGAPVDAPTRKGVWSVDVTTKAPGSSSRCSGWSLGLLSRG